MYRILWSEPAALSATKEEVYRSFESMTVEIPEFGDIPWRRAPEPVLVSAGKGVRNLTEELPDEALPDFGALASLRHAFVDAPEDAEAAQDAIAERLGIPADAIEIQPEPMEAVPSRPVPIGPFDSQPTPSLLGTQGYLYPSVAGVDAGYAHSRPGGDGSGVAIVDIEWGWGAHEELGQNYAAHVYGVPIVSSHGTAVLSVIGARNDGQGMLGVAPKVVKYSASPRLPDGSWNLEGALATAATAIGRNDVVLLELDVGGRPLEDSPSLRRVIRAVVASGRYVVEAAGNGGLNLNALPLTADDSGAILVGAGHSLWDGVPRSRVPMSNFGRRVDCQGWGEHVVAAGGHSAPRWSDFVQSTDSRRCYTLSFDGTSAAGAQVAGVVASLIGRLRAAQRPMPSFAQLRHLLRESGSPQGGSNTVNDRIGPLPDLKALYQALGVA